MVIDIDDNPRKPLAPQAFKEWRLFISDEDPCGASKAD
jgi:hypothetical protein